MAAWAVGATCQLATDGRARPSERSCAGIRRGSCPPPQAEGCNGRDRPRPACDPASMPVLQIKAKPNARVAALTPQPDGTWLAQLKSPPVDGKANAELIALVAAHFGCARSAVTIKSGAGGRFKRVMVPD